MQYIVASVNQPERVWASQSGATVDTRYVLWLEDWDRDSEPSRVGWLDVSDAVRARLGDQDGDLGEVIATSVRAPLRGEVVYGQGRPTVRVELLIRRCY